MWRNCVKKCGQVHFFTTFLLLFLVQISRGLQTSTPGVTLPSSYWKWNDYSIRYTQAGNTDDPPIILIHGFGASLDYYRKQYPAFSEAGFCVYGIDLLGFGGSQKVIQPLGGYSANVWAQQVVDFMREVVIPKSGKNFQVVVGGNSIGSRIALEAALEAPDIVRGLLLYNAAAGINNKFTITDTLTPISLKLFAVPIFTVLDFLLKNSVFSTWLFERTRSRENIRSTLQSVYVNKDACDDYLVDSIASAAEDPNALKVFVEILTNAPGATPDTFIDKVLCPIKFIWGDEDPFTPLNGPYGQYFQKFCTERESASMSVIRGGHCPHDDCHDEANAVALTWLRGMNSPTSKSR